jgi:enterochelin esterase-like enzyme
MTRLPLSSPRLRALRQRLRAGDRAAIDAFWQEARQHGAPLVEPIPGDPDHGLVTFLYRGDAGVRNVVVILSDGDVLPYLPRENRLTRLLDTDIWYKSYVLPADLHLCYRLSVNDPLATARTLSPARAASRTMGGADPLNHRPVALQVGNLSIAFSCVSLPVAPPQPWLVPQPGVARGVVEEHRFRSARLGNERAVWLYTPPQPAPAGEPYRLVVLFDGETYSSTIPTPTILDNLLAAGRIAPLVAVLVGCIDWATRWREFGCHEPFVDFLGTKLLPWVRQRVPVTTDPRRTIVGGLSGGGTAAAFAALRRPDLFGNVLAQSGAFWWSSEDPEMLARQFARAAPAPLRFYLEAGRMENVPPVTRGGPSLLVANRHLRDVLEAKGYEVHYREHSGGHDVSWWRGTLADGLQVLAANTPGGAP